MKLNTITIILSFFFFSGCGLLESIQKCPGYVEDYEDLRDEWSTLSYTEKTLFKCNALNETREDIINKSCTVEATNSYGDKEEIDAEDLPKTEDLEFNYFEDCEEISCYYQMKGLRNLVDDFNSYFNNNLEVKLCETWDEIDIVVTNIDDPIANCQSNFSNMTDFYAASIFELVEDWKVNYRGNDCSIEFINSLNADSSNSIPNFDSKILE